MTAVSISGICIYRVWGCGSVRIVQIRSTVVEHCEFRISSMSSIKRRVVPVIIAIAIVFSLSSVKGEDVNEQEHFCNLKINADESNEEWNISSLLSSLIEETPTHGYSQHLNFNGYYGVAACNGQISKEDCGYCLDFANNALFKSCGFSDGGQIKLGDCRLRFERYEISDW